LPISRMRREQLTARGGARRRAGPRRRARQHGLKLSDFALAIVRGDIAPDAVAPGSGPQPVT